MSATKEHSGGIPVMELSYMKAISFTLGLMDAWPYEELGMKRRITSTIRNTKALFIFWTILLFFGISYLKTNLHVLSFFDLGHSYLTISMNCISVQRTSMVWTKAYKELAKDFVHRMHLYHHKDKSEHSMKVHNQVEKMCTFASRFIHFQFYSGVLFFNMVPMMNNYNHGMYSFHNKPENGTYEHSVYYDFPFDYITNDLTYTGVCLANLILTYDCGCCFCIYDLYLIIIIFHLYGHLKILRGHLENFPRPEMEGQTMNPVENPPWYNEEESERVLTMLKDNIRHHLLIKDFMEATSNAFGFTICVYYAFHQIGDTLLLLECSQLDAEAVVKYGILTVFMFQQLIQISIVFELLGTQSETIKDAVYSVPWECMGTKNRKIVLFFLYNVQEPLNLKALGMVPVGVQTMASILKTSISYFMLLHAVAPDE